MSLRKSAASGLVWTFTHQFGSQIISFIVSLVLARLLLPEEFGLIGMIAILISVGQSLMHAGLTQSLIRSQEVDQADYSTVFFFNLIASLIIYCFVFFIAPLVAEFYQQEILIKIIRLYCIIFVINSLTAVHQARLIKRMDFKTPTLIAIPANIIGGGVGIYLAYNGFGVWSLVWSQIISAVFNTFPFWVYTKWMPSITFDFTKFSQHLNFGFKLTLSGLLETIFKNAYLIIIGKFFSPAQVGFYTRAETMKHLPVHNITSALNSVTYPLLSSIQNDDQRLRRVYKQIMQITAFVTAPVLLFLAVLAEPTFRFLFTEKWLPAVPYFQILCFTGLLYPIQVFNLNILKVKGKGSLILKLELVKKLITVALIAVTLPFGIMALLYGQLFNSLFGYLINTHYSGKFIEYRTFEQSKDILIIFLNSFIAACTIWTLDTFVLFEYGDLLRIVLGSFFGGIVYLLFSSFFEREVMIQVQNFLIPGKKFDFFKSTEK